MTKLVGSFEMEPEGVERESVVMFGLVATLRVPGEVLRTVAVVLLVLELVLD